jgi:hypothetical protein
VGYLEVYDLSAVRQPGWVSNMMSKRWILHGVTRITQIMRPGQASIFSEHFKGTAREGNVRTLRSAEKRSGITERSKSAFSKNMDPSPLTAALRVGYPLQRTKSVAPTEC